MATSPFCFLNISLRLINIKFLLGIADDSNFATELIHKCNITNIKIMARIINVTLSFAVDTDLMSVDSIIDNLDFRVTENSENVEVIGGLVQIEDFFEVYQEPTAPKKTKQELIDAISEKLSQAEDEKIVLDDDKEVYLFNGNTEKQLGECFRIECLYQTHLVGQTQVYVGVDADEYNEGWLLDDCSQYELNLIYNTFFND